MILVCDWILILFVEYCLGIRLFEFRLLELEYCDGLVFYLRGLEMFLDVLCDKS